MRVRRVVWFGVSGIALASWFAAASTSGVRAPLAAPAPLRPSGLDRSMSALQSDVDRLHARLAPTAVPTRSRDLFRFSARPPARVASPPAAVQPDAGAAADSAPPQPLALIGVAEDSAADGAAIRTAIISARADLFLVKAGDVIQARYRVEQVSSDAVQLVDTTTGAAVTLALR